MQPNEVKRRKGMKSVGRSVSRPINFVWSHSLAADKGNKEGRTDGQTCGRKKRRAKTHMEEKRATHTHSWIMGPPSLPFSLPSLHPPSASDSNEISISTTLIKRWETSAAVDDGIPENSPHARTHVSSVTAGFHIG